MYASVNDPKVTRNTAAKKPPGFITETVFLCVSLFLLKLYSDAAFDALSFVTVLIPIMVFFLLSIVFNILKFIKLLHTEELDEDAGILSPKQIKLLFTVARNLLAYFGVYMISGELDKHITHEELGSLNLGPAAASLASGYGPDASPPRTENFPMKNHNHMITLTNEKSVINRLIEFSKL